MPNRRGPRRRPPTGRERRARDQERRAFTADLLGRRLPKRDTQALIATRYLAGAPANQAKAACGLLGIEAPLTGYPDHRAALAAYVAARTGQRDRACLALALAAGDEAVSDDPTGQGEAAAAHLAFLGAYGWPTNPVIDQTAEPDAESAA